MNVHLFGYISSPSCANFALRQRAKDNGKYYGTEAEHTLYKNFYVDDFLKYMETVEEAKELVLTLVDVCKAGGFDLRKFNSNCKEIIKALDEEERIDINQIVQLSEQLKGHLKCNGN